jgi:hypothetical protein
MSWFSVCWFTVLDLRLETILGYIAFPKLARSVDRLFRAIRDIAHSECLGWVAESPGAQL